MAETDHDQVSGQDRKADNKKDRRWPVLFAFGSWLVLFCLVQEWMGEVLVMLAHDLHKVELSGTRLAEMLPTDTYGDLSERAQGMHVWRQGEQSPRLAFFLNRSMRMDQVRAEDLAMIPGIGPVLAEKIILYRQRHGIGSAADLTRVPGVGAVLSKRLARYLDFSGS